MRSILKTMLVTLFTFGALQSAIGAPKQAVNLTVKTEGNNLQFTPKTLTVHAGQQVVLTFQNAASPDSGMTHTWTLVRPGTADSVSASGASAGASKDYVADDEKKDVIAHTHVLNPGQSQTVRFVAPKKPGDYPYICTFPSHYPSMKGVLTVTP